MNMRTSATGTLAAAALFCLSTAAQAMTVTYSDIKATDGTDSLGFSVAGTSVNGGDPNILDVDVTPFTLSSGGASAMSDTLIVTITAASGYYIEAIEFAESGDYDASNGFAAATVQMLAGGAGSEPGGQAYFNSAGSWGPLSQMLDISSLKLTSVTVSVSNQLFVGNASIEKTSAQLAASVAPIPLPAAVWMLGTSLASLLVVTGRNRRAAA
ncbi:MAG: hypothetical protein RLW61_10510 [Gammaproteobacteria bacterium]